MFRRFCVAKIQCAERKKYAVNASANCVSRS